MSQYKLIKELGLISFYSVYEQGVVVKAEDLERVLENAVKVYAYMGPASRPGGIWINEGQQDADSTHTALLLNVKPIEKPDTAERLLRDYIEAHETGSATALGYGEFLIRARKLIKEQK